MPKLTERDVDTLNELDAYHANMRQVGDPDRGARPMDCGGSNGSHHSATLAKLAKTGHVIRKKYGGHRGSCLYWITDEGRKLLRDRGLGSHRGAR